MKRRFNYLILLLASCVIFPANLLCGSAHQDIKIGNYFVSAPYGIAIIVDDATAFVLDPVCDEENMEGDSSRNLHVLESSYENRQLQLLVEGRPDIAYQIRLLTPWRIAAATSAKSIIPDGEWRILEVSATPDAIQHSDKAGYVRWKITATVDTQ